MNNVLLYVGIACLIIQAMTIVVILFKIYWEHYGKYWEGEN